jgi:uncharacterized membrane protein
MQARQPLLGICTLVAMVSAPLFLRLIGMNSIYGLRTPQTLSSAEAWYNGNAFTGWVFLFAAVLSAGLLLFAPGSNRLVPSIGYFVIPMTLALGAALIYVGRLS